MIRSTLAKAVRSAMAASEPSAIGSCGPLDLRHNTANVGEAGRGDVTQLLGQWAGGDQTALDALIPVVYAELRRIADAYLRRERSDHTLQPTALVHEAWLRLVR